MVEFMICLIAIFIFTIFIIQYMRTKGSKKDPSVDGLNKFKPYKSNDLFKSDVGSLEYLEKIGAVQTNITGANPFGDKRI